MVHDMEDRVVCPITVYRTRLALTARSRSQSGSEKSRVKSSSLWYVSLMQDSWDPSDDLSDVFSVPVILGNEPSISSNRPLDVEIWLEQCDMVRYLSMRFTHHCELRTSWCERYWVLELG